MKYIKKYYPDGSFYPIIEEFTTEFTFRINNYQDLWLLKQIKDVYDYNNKNAVVNIPNLLDAQADRRFNINESHNLKLILKELNNMRWISLNIFHPHNQELVEALLDNTHIIDNSNFIKDTILSIDGNGYLDFNFYKCRQEDKLVLLSSDAGGFKPLMKLCDKLNWKGETFSASKSRKYENNESKLIQLIDKEDFKRKNILIIDDICVYGGTFIGLSKLLRERNVGKIYLAISHLTVDKPNPDLFKSFDKVFTTDSKDLQYVNEFSNQPDNLTIFKYFN